MADSLGLDLSVFNEKPKVELPDSYAQEQKQPTANKKPPEVVTNPTQYSKPNESVENVISNEVSNQDKLKTFIERYGDLNKLKKQYPDVGEKPLLLGLYTMARTEGIDMPIGEFAGATGYSGSKILKPVDEFRTFIASQIGNNPAGLKKLNSISDEKLTNDMWDIYKKDGTLPIHIKSTNDKKEFINEALQNPKDNGEEYLRNTIAPYYNLMMFLPQFIQHSSAKIGALIGGATDKEAEAFATEQRKQAEKYMPIPFAMKQTGETFLGYPADVFGKVMGKLFGLGDKGVDKIIDKDKHPLAHEIAKTLTFISMGALMHYGMKGGAKLIHDRDINQGLETFKKIKEDNPNIEIFAKDHPFAKIEEAIDKDPDITNKDLRKIFNDSIKEIKDTEAGKALSHPKIFKEYMKKLPEDIKAELEKIQNETPIREEIAKELSKEDKTLETATQEEVNRAWNRIWRREDTTETPINTDENQWANNWQEKVATDQKNKQELLNKWEEQQPSDPIAQNLSNVYKEEPNIDTTRPAEQGNILSSSQNKPPQGVEQVSDKLTANENKIAPEQSLEQKNIIEEKNLQNQPIDTTQQSQPDIMTQDVSEIKPEEIPDVINAATEKINQETKDINSQYHYDEVNEITPEEKEIMENVDVGELPTKGDIGDEIISETSSPTKTINKIDEVMKDPDISDDVKGLLRPIQEKIVRLGLIPSMIAEIGKNKPVTYMYNMWQKVKTYKNRGIREDLQFFDGDGLMTTINDNRKLRKAFADVDYTMDKEADSIIEKEKALAESEGKRFNYHSRGEVAQAKIESILDRHKLLPKEREMVKEFYDRVRKKYDIYHKLYKKDVLNSIKNRTEIYKNALDNINEKIINAETSEEFSQLKLEKERMEALLKNAYEEAKIIYGDVGYNPYYSPHLWDNKGRVALIYEKIRNKNGKVIGTELRKRKIYSIGDAVLSGIKEGSFNGYVKSLRKDFPSNDYIIKTRNNVNIEDVVGDQVANDVIGSFLLDRIVGKSGLSREDILDLKKTFYDHLRARGFAAHFLKRKNIGGYVTDKPIESLLSYVAGFHGSQAKKAFIDALEYMPEARSMEEMATANKYMHNLLRNEGQWDVLSGKVRGALFFRYLGGKISTPIRNMTQPYTMTVPYLIAQNKELNGKYNIADTYKTVALSQKDSLRIAKDLLSNNTKQILDNSKKWNLTTEEKNIILDLWNNGTFNSAMGELTGKTQTGFVHAGQKIIDILGLPFHFSDVSNRVTTALATYRLFKDKDLAHKAVLDTQFVYDKSNLPIALGGNDAGAALGRSAYALQSYFPNETRVWYSFLKKKQMLPFAISLATLGALGGAEAIPLIGYLSKKAEQKTGTDFWQKIKDQSNLAYTLLRFGMPGPAGLDLSGQFGGSIPGMNNYTVAQDQSLIEYLGTNLLGAIAGVLNDIDKSVKLANKGEYGRSAVKLLAPKSIQNIVDAYLGYKLGLQDTIGIPKHIINSNKKWQDTKYTKGEAIGKAIGFSTSKVSKMYDINTHAKLVKNYYKKRLDLIKGKVNRIIRDSPTINGKKNISPENKELIKKMINDYADMVKEKMKKGDINTLEYMQQMNAIKGILDSTFTRPLVNELLVSPATNKEVRKILQEEK